MNKDGNVYRTSENQCDADVRITIIRGYRRLVSWRIVAPIITDSYTYRTDVTLSVLIDERHSSDAIKTLCVLQN